jgi:acyl carrier protein
MSIRSTIVQEIYEIASEQGKTIAPLRDDLILLDSGLDSLCFAILVARLEDKLGLDPFTMAETAHFPVTLLDFINLYEQAIEPTAIAS